MAEIWDLYYPDGTPAGRTMVRGDKIPEGLRHLICEVLVRHVDGDYLLMHRCATKSFYPNCWEATAGGSALQGEDVLACIRRELWEETGIAAGDFCQVSRRTDREDCIFYTYLCVTEWDKTAITPQKGETDDFRWLSEAEFIEFVNSDQIIDIHYHRWEHWFRKMGYVK